MAGMPASLRDTVPLERLSAFRPRPHARHVVFDFDGTLSLLRGQWAEVMLGIFREQVPRLPGEDPGDLDRLLLHDIWSLNGRPSIQQMARLAERVAGRGGRADTAARYEAEYQRRLALRTSERVAAIHAPGGSADRFLVPGARAVLAALARRGLMLHLVSGTLERDVREEAQLLGISGYFDHRIHGPSGGDDGFSKGACIDRILRVFGCTGEHVIAFGDGVTEITETVRVGGLAIAVASDERGSGALDAAKRSLLIERGAHAVIPHYGDGEQLVATVLGREQVPA